MQRIIFAAFEAKSERKMLVFVREVLSMATFGATLTGRTCVRVSIGLGLWR